MNDTIEFSEDGYLNLVRKFKRINYRFCGFEDVQATEADVIMRHDIDHSLSYAVRFAEIEAREDVCAYYFILVSSEFYNIFAPNSRKALAKIRDLGHKIGLHFDSTVYSGDRHEMEAAAFKECAILEDVAEVEVTSISFHRPAPELLGLEGNFASRLHTYQTRFFHGLEYCTDSDLDWKQGPPLAREAVLQRKAMHLVTHPIWWCTDPNLDVIGKIEQYRQEKDEYLREELRRNLKPYARHCQ